MRVRCALLVAAVGFVGCGANVEEQRQELRASYAFIKALGEMTELSADHIHGVWGYAIQNGLPSRKIAELLEHPEAVGDSLSNAMQTEGRDALQTGKPRSKELKDAYSILEEIFVEIEAMNGSISNLDGSYISFGQEIAAYKREIRQLQARWKLAISE